MGDATLQVSSGKRVTVASDAPDEVSALLRLKADQRHTTRLESTWHGQDGCRHRRPNPRRVHPPDGPRAAAGGPGANQTLDADKRLSLAHEVESLQAQMQSYSPRRSAVPADVPGGRPGAGGSFAVSQGCRRDLRSPQRGWDAWRRTTSSRRSTICGSRSRITTPGDHHGDRFGQDGLQHLNSMEAFYGTVQNRIHGGD